MEGLLRMTLVQVAISGITQSERVNQKCLYSTGIMANSLDVVWLELVVLLVCAMSFFTICCCETSHPFTKLLIEGHPESIAVYHQNVRSPVHCGKLCVQHREDDEWPCEAYDFHAEDNTCELFTGEINEAVNSSGRVVYAYGSRNSSNNLDARLSFFVSNVKMDFLLARNYCLTHGSHLLHIDSLGDYADLRTYFVSEGLTRKEFWVGANDLETEGRWVCDRHNITLDRSLWLFDEGEPNDKRGEDCVVLRGNMRLNDISCDTTFYVICEKSADT